jgi:predicted lipid-binding transport protein (Tim44 family)
MYCQNCGGEIQPGLNYCNRCGALVNSSMSAPPERLVPADIASPVRWISATVGLSFLIGLITIFVAIGELAGMGMNHDGVMFIAFFGLVTLFGIEVSLIRLLSRLIGVSKERGTFASALQRKKELKASPPQAYIPPTAKAYTDPLPSVTEHTTRTFAAAYREPRAGE